MSSDPNFYEDWYTQERDEDIISAIEREFADPDARSDLTDANIVVAEYIDECYEGSAFVLYEKDGKVYEVNASHCSCHGLEGQWSPEETTWKALAMRRWKETPYGERVLAEIAKHQGDDAP